MEITIDGTIKIFRLYSEGESYLLNKLRYWNNFDSNQPLEISVTKPLDPDALSIAVSDTANIAEMLNRP